MVAEHAEDRARSSSASRSIEGCWWGARRGRLPRLRGQPLRGLALPGSSRELPGQVRSGRREGARRPGPHGPPATTGRSPATPISPRRSRSSRRTHQILVWSRQRQLNQLRSTLREFYPGALQAFGRDLASPRPAAILAIAPTPERGRRLTPAQISPLARGLGSKAPAPGGGPRRSMMRCELRSSSAPPSSRRLTGRR